MSSIGAMLDELVRRGVDDWIGAWEVADIVQSIAPGATGEISKLALQVIQEALVRSLVEIGDVVGTGSHPVYGYESCSFRPWALPVEAAMERVKREWLALGRNPTLGEVCWLNLSETGRARAHHLS
jgi:hypothetical protein